MTDLCEKRRTGGGRCLVKGVFLRNMVTLETLIAFDNFDFLLVLIYPGNTPWKLLKTTSSQSQVLCSKACENISRLTKRQRQKRSCFCFILSHFSLLFHTQASAPLSFTGAGFTRQTVKGCLYVGHTLHVSVSQRGLSRAVEQVLKSFTYKNSCIFIPVSKKKKY